MSERIDFIHYGLVVTLAVWLVLLGLRTRVRRMLKRDRTGVPPGSGVPGLPRTPGSGVPGLPWTPGSGVPGLPGGVAGLPGGVAGLPRSSPGVVELAAKLGLGVIAALVVLVPAGGLPLWKWAFSFCPNPSLPLLTLIGAAIVPRVFGVALFGPADWRAAWGFGAVVGTVLYLQPFCFPSFDLYFWGSETQVVAWTLAGTAVLFLLAGLRFGVVFLLALAAYHVGLLESRNGWEYTMDAFYWLISVGVVATGAVRSVVRRRKRSGDGASALPGLAAQRQG